MNKSKIRTSAICILFLVLSLFFLLVIPSTITTSMVITAVFTVVAYVSQLVMWMLKFSKVNNSQEVFYRTPAMVVSTVYLSIQFIVCLIMAFVGGNITDKMILIVNFVVLILAWILIIALSGTKDYVQRIDSRQKNHHTEI